MSRVSANRDELGRVADELNTPAARPPPIMIYSSNATGDRRRFESDDGVHISSLAQTAGDEEHNP